MKEDLEALVLMENPPPPPSKGFSEQFVLNLVETSIKAAK